MKRAMLMTLFTLQVGASVLLVTAPALAQAPQTLSYQGVLKNDDGTPVPDGNYDLTFHIYDTASGGTALWTEAQAIPVVNATFNAILGSIETLDLPFNAPYWPGIQVGGNPELTPRIQLTAAPYALNVASGKVVKSVNSLTDDVTLAAGANVSILPSGNTLTISATGTGADADWVVDGSDMHSAVPGNVGIGTATPVAELHVGSNGNTELRIDCDDIESRLSFYGSLNGASRDAYVEWNNDNGALNLSANGSTHDISVTQSNGNVGVGTDQPLSRTHVQNFDVQVPPAALHSDDLVVESQDAIVGLYSTPSGDAGSGLSFGEILTGTLVDKWSILRESTGGDGGLRLSYGVNADPLLNSTVLYLDDTGEVGIGTRSPDAELEVAGQVKITGGSPGAGKVLTSDNDGLASWEAVTTEYAVSPTKMFDQDFPDNVTFYYDHGVVEVQPSSGGSHSSYVTLPVDIPAKISGVRQKLQAIRVYYSVNDASDYISATEVYCVRPDGTNEALISSPGDHNSTTWSDYTITTAGQDIDGSLVVRFYLHWTDGGSMHRINIGTVLLYTTTD